MIQIRDQLKNKNFNGSTNPRNYNLDVVLEESQVNKKLQFYSSETLNQPTEPLFEQYTINTVNTNFINFLSESMLQERNNIFPHYWEQGFLGRALIFLIDSMIQACLTSFQLMKQRAEHSESRIQIPPAVSCDLVLYDLVEIEREKQIKFLRALVTDCK